MNIPKKHQYPKASSPMFYWFDLKLAKEIARIGKRNLKKLSELLNVK